VCARLSLSLCVFLSTTLMVMRSRREFVLRGDLLSTYYGQVKEEGASFCAYQHNWGLLLIRSVLYARFSIEVFILGVRVR